MFKRVGVLAMILAGSLAVLTPSVAQARDWNDHRYDRHEDRRAWDRRNYRAAERREFRRDEYRDRRYYEPRPYFYNGYVAPAPYCPR